MKLSLQDAFQLAQDALTTLGYSPDRATLISKHLLDSHMRGFSASGFPRILSIRDRLGGKSPADLISTTRENPVTAQLNGHDTLGYIVASEATSKAIQKAKQLGIAIVGANNTWYTGMLSYFAEMCAKEGLVSIIASNTSPWVAPHGGYKAINGTNPFCVGFPTAGIPVIYDIGTSKILHADVMLAQRLGIELPSSSAFDSSGNSTRDPADVLNGGAIAPWGGHKGTGLATVVQLLGVLAGSPASPPNLEQFGFTVIVIDPGIFRSREEYLKEVDAHCEMVRESPTVDGGRTPLRLPFERSFRTREDVMKNGEVEMDTEVYEMLQKLIQEKTR